jgi:hypothetical protein
MTASDPSPAPTPSSLPPDADAIPTRLSLDWPAAEVPQAPPASPPNDPGPSVAAAVVTTPGVVVAAEPVVLARAWPLWQRILFRFAMCYVLLYSLPSPWIDWFRVVASGLDFVAWRADVPQLKEGAFTWPKTVSEGIGGIQNWDQQVPGAIELGWQGVTTWTAANVWQPFGEVIHQGTGSGDTAHDWMRVAVILALAMLLTLVWSVCDRRPIGYPRLGRWLHLHTRFYVGFVVFSYGVAKVYGGQFGELGPLRMTTEVGDLGPMTMVGTFMQASRPYELLSAVGEIVGGLLLFHRRTVLLGALLTIAVMGNVVALNWLHGVPVKLFSTHLLLFTVGLLAPYAASLWALLVRNRATQPVDLAVVKAPWLGWLLAIFGWSWVVAHVVDAHFEAQRNEVRAAERFGAKPALFGAWRVESMSLDGVEIPRSDASRWTSFGVDRANVFGKEASGRMHWLRVTERLAEGKLQVQPAAGGPAAEWTVEQGSKQVKEANWAPKTRTDRNRPVEANRRTLLLKGTWAGKQLELRLVERAFRLQRGFQWVQELPEGW